MVVLTTQRWFGSNFHLSVAGETICAGLVVRYLGVWVDLPLAWWEHIRRAADKAANVTEAHTRLMAIVGFLRKAKRRLLASVSNLILLYGMEVWVHSFELLVDALVRQDVQEHTTVQRIGFFKIACAYHTVYSAVVMVIARTILVVLLPPKRQKKFLGFSDKSDSDRCHTYQG
ncbi:uncharacterized protein LOC111643954 [Copidosoma floridanum]|uniref:uncharacterized protein LOC111643954 n=1 Tax=Copidosoma floridanum TaxID=29053 RepID=UPI0006C97F0A|nr:uncharacterized protein LOC111643954 [Copidosoma floridanum]